MWNLLSPALTCCLGMLLLCGLGLSAPASAASDVELRAEVDDLIRELNAKFGLNVVTKVSTKCGFRVDGPFGKASRYDMEFCDREIAYFAGLPEQERPVEGLLTIIAHEYAHVLLDFDISGDARLVWDMSSGAMVNQVIRARAGDPAFRKKMLAVYEWAYRITQQEEEENDEEIDKIILGVRFVFELGAHENVDGLAVKLLHFLGRTPHPAVMNHVAATSVESDRWELNGYSQRLQAMHVGDKDGLRSWENHKCWGDTTSAGYAPTLRAVMSREGHTALLAPLARTCGTEQADAFFQDLLDRYFPDI